jgi:hypothetical protein
MMTHDHSDIEDRISTTKRDIPFLDGILCLGFPSPRALILLFSQIYFKDDRMGSLKKLWDEYLWVRS